MLKRKGGDVFFMSSIAGLGAYPNGAAYCAAKFGVTGLAQTRGRGNLTFIATNEADLEYVRHRSLALDLRILFRTLGVTVKRDGAF